MKREQSSNLNELGNCSQNINNYYLYKLKSSERKNG